MPCGQPLNRTAPGLTLGIVVGACLLAGCAARAVEITAPTPAPEVVAPCATFTGTLPPTLSTIGERREVTPDSDLTAAYGDPPVGIRCGVPEPTALAATSSLVTVEGVEWFPEELTAGWRMTSIGRVANVEITVPDGQGPAPSVAADLAPTIAAALPAIV